MSRSGYNDDGDVEDQWAWIRWRGAVASAIKGKRGQAFLKECLAALEAMPVKELHSRTWQADGKYCTLGVLGCARGIDMTTWDTEYFEEAITNELGVNEKVLREIIWHNDEYIGEYDENGNWQGTTQKIEKFGPPMYSTRIVGGRLYPYSIEDMTYTMPREDSAARRWKYMADWLKSQIKPEEDNAK